MRKRLQVLLEESELDEVRRVAERNHLTVAEWLRQALRTARRQEPEREAPEKLDAIRRAAEHNFPTGDIDQVLVENESKPI